MSALRLGFIGLGQMGLQMASNLFSKSSAAAIARPSSYVVCDPNPTSLKALSSFFQKHIPQSELIVVDTPLEVTQRANTIFTMLPSSPQVTSVYLGPSGILEALSSSAPMEGERRLFVDSTTLDVSVAREVSKKVSNAGADIVDAPVSGGVVGAQAGTLSFMVGGTESSFERAKPFLELMGQRIIYCGASGNGLIAKLCNNHILGINQIAIAEGMLLGTSLGLAPDLLASIINTSTGRSWPSEVNNPVPGALPDKSPPCDRDYIGGFASKLMLKDMLLAADAAKPVSVPLPIGDRCVNLYTEMIENDKDVKNTRIHETSKPARGDRDFSVVYEYLDEIKARS